MSVGVVDGRNLWRNNPAVTWPLLTEAREILGSERLIIAPSCSLQHVPVALRHETKLDPELRGWLSFAEEKLGEVAALRLLIGGEADPGDLAANRAAAESRRRSPRIHRPAVQTPRGAV